MRNKTLPWGIQSIFAMWVPNAMAELPDGRCVRAVSVPYPLMGFERLRAAWWVFTGQAHAVTWPEAGDIEAALFREPSNAR